MTALEIGAAILSAAAAIGLAVLLARRPARETDSALEWASIACLSIAFLCGHVAVLGLPSWSAWEHQPFRVNLAAVICGALQALRSPRPLTAACATLAVGWLVFWPCSSAEWPAADSRCAALILLAMAAFVVFDVTLRTTPCHGRIDGPIVWGALCAGLAMICLHSGHARFAILAAVLGGIGSPVVLVVLASAGRRLPLTMGTGFTLIWMSILAGAWFHTLAHQRAPSTAFILLAAAAPASRIADITALASSPRLRAVVRVAVVGGIVGLAIGSVGLLQDPPVDMPGEDEARD